MNTLFQAIVYGDYKAVEKLLENTWYGATDENGLTGLHYAAVYNQPKIAQLFVDKGLFINQTTYEGEQPLHLAAKAHQHEMVDWLMNNGAAILAVDYQGNTPLHYAVLDKPDPAFVQTLIDYGSNLSTQNNDGQTALNWIEANDNSELIVLFLQNGAVSENLPSLLQAVVDADAAQVAIQLESSWYGTTDSVGLTGLHYAAALGLPEIGQLFLEEGLFVNRTTYDGKQSLHIAAMTGSSAMVDMLMENGAAIRAVDYEGNTPLHYAVQNQTDVSFVNQLLQYGADINATNNQEQTPLSLIEDAGNDALFVFLLEQGATSASISPLLSAAILGDVDGVNEALNDTWSGDTNKHGNTGVHMAAQYNHPEVAQAFIEQGLFINQTNYDGEQPLHTAALFHQAEMVDFIMNNGGAILAVDYEGNTPLHNAVSSNADVDFVQQLVDYGSNLDTRNNDGKTALDIATEQGNTELADFLTSAGATPLLVEDPPLLVVASDDEPSQGNALTEDDIMNFNLDNLFASFDKQQAHSVDNVGFGPTPEHIEIPSIHEMDVL